MGLTNNNNNTNKATDGNVEAQVAESRRNGLGGATAARLKVPPASPRLDLGVIEYNLESLGYLPFRQYAPGGHSKAEIKDALKAFQKGNGLPQTGEMDKKSIDLLDGKSRGFKRELDQAKKLYEGDPSDKNINNLYGVIKKYCVDADQIIADLKRFGPDVGIQSRLSHLYVTGP